MSYLRQVVGKEAHKQHTSSNGYNEYLFGDNLVNFR